MKLISLLVFLFSTTVFAKGNYDDFDDYTTKCSREACIELEGSGHGFYEFIDQDGYSFLKLNTKSSLMDMYLEKGCFRGDKFEVLEIIEALAGNTNQDYAQGGHISVVGIVARTLTSEQIIVKISFITDYDQGTLNLTQTINKCD